MEHTTHPPACVASAPTIGPLLTYHEAGKLLGVTERTVFTMVKTGELPAARFGRSVRIDPVDLRKFIDKAKHQAGSVGVTDTPDMEVGDGE